MGGGIGFDCEVYCANCVATLGAAIASERALVSAAFMDEAHEAGRRAGLIEKRVTRPWSDPVFVALVAFITGYIVSWLAR